MCDPVTLTIGSMALSAATGVASYVQGQKADKTQKKATATADANAKAGLKEQERAINKANSKAPNVAALLAQNQNDTALGATNLTGPGGVKKSELQLGKNALLGT
jgi:hypothetical protein